MEDIVVAPYTVWDWRASYRMLPSFTQDERDAILPDVYVNFTDDQNLIGLFVVFFAVFRPLFQYGFSKMLARWLGLEAGKVIKFCDALWEALYYLVSTSWGWYLAFSYDWSFDPIQYFRGFPYFRIPPPMRYFIMMQWGFYIHGIMFLFTQHKKKDFVVMLVHHVATIGLIAMSMAMSLPRVTFIVLIIHDPCDVLLNGGKVFLYFGYQKFSDGVFVLFTLMWIVTRLTLLPLLIIVPSTTIHPYVTCPPYTPPLYYEAYYTLLLLQSLHVYWFVLIARMVGKFVRSSKVEGDIRSDSE